MDLQTLVKTYKGQADLVQSEGFWQEVPAALQDRNVRLPVQYNPSNVRMLHGWLKCPPGKCGQCCHYPKVSLSPFDMRRLLEAGHDVKTVVKSDQDNLYLDASAGCPLLVDGICSVYEARPEVCFMFPIQRVALADGTISGFVYIRVKCVQSVALIRRVLASYCHDTGAKLNPDLTWEAA